MCLRAGPDGLRVDQNQRLVTIIRHIDHNQLLMHIHLRGGQSDAFGVVHGLQHIGNQSPDAGIHPLYRFGHRVQLGVWKVKQR